MVNETTSVFKPIRTKEDKVDAVLVSVVSIMDYYGYNGSEQLAGYLLSGDPTYITSKGDCRVTIGKIDRFVLLDHVVKKYIKSVTKENTVIIKEENNV